VTLPDLDLARIRRFVDARNGRIAASSRQFIRVEVEVDGDAAKGDGEADVTIVERRAPWDVDLAGPEWTRKPIARLRYTVDLHTWALFWVDPSSRFRPYDQLPESAGLADLLDEIDHDRLTVFWR
jgi:hypothetical protein